MVRRAKTELLLRTFKWSGRMRERGSDANWFPVEYLAYLDDDGKRRSFTAGRKTAATYLMAIIFFGTNLVNEASDGGSGRASGSSDGDIERLKNLKVDECYGQN